MNLELLDPFQRQIPDRVDATLSLPTILHFRKKADKASDADNNEDWKSANHVAFNRRGAYIAVGYGSGTVGVFDVLSRTLSGLYRSGDTVSNDQEPNNNNNNNDSNNESSSSTEKSSSHGVTSVSWSRRSRTLLAGATGDTEVRLIDTTHPYGPEECCLGITKEEAKEPTEDGERSQSPSLETTENKQPKVSSFAKPRSPHDHHKKPVYLKVKTVKTNKDKKAKPGKRKYHQSQAPVSTCTRKRYPSIHFQLPLAVGSSLQVHPRDTCAGLATLNDGSLVAFWVPLAGWEDAEEQECPPQVKLATIFKDSSQFITYAAFDPHGDKIYAVTTEGTLMGFEVACIFDHLAKDAKELPYVKPGFTIHIPGGATAWHLIVSRNGRYLVVNSSDAAIRLYSTKECWTTPEEVDKPTWVFQDVVSKVKFSSCDISGDAEFVVGGTNGVDNKYELYIWNTSTGALMDKLTGSTVELYSVAWHPTRSFLAVAASDGLVDIWGPRINWTAFAPDFQALPQNVEYVECEDEFDIDDDDKEDEPKKEEDEDENGKADVLTIESVPVFASDTEDEEDVFYFDTKVTRLLGALTS
jgi:WD40 repeat protein